MHLIINCTVWESFSRIFTWVLSFDLHGHAVFFTQRKLRASEGHTGHGQGAHHVLDLLTLTPEHWYTFYRNYLKLPGEISHDWLLIIQWQLMLHLYSSRSSNFIGFSQPVGENHSFKEERGEELLV